jgi:hypothetical protein
MAADIPPLLPRHHPQVAGEIRRTTTSEDFDVRLRSKDSGLLEATATKERA